MIKMYLVGLWTWWLRDGVCGATEEILPVLVLH